MVRSEDINRAEAGPPLFTTTHWSVVLAAGSTSDTRALQALEQLCRFYWYPLYAYARSRGATPHDAQDIIQGFFEQLLRRESLARRTPEQGRFRSFLLASLNYYLADLRDHANAAKRGAGQLPIPLDSLAAEERYRYEPVDRLTPERIFERRWALTVVDAVLNRVEAECLETGQIEQFRALRPYLFGGEEQSGYEQLAASLDSTSGALRVVAHRLRQRCRHLLRQELAQTLENPEEVDLELQHLRAVLAG
jgi:RNA polymerase sigma-70 factor (ECF subfamily)